MKLPRKPRAVIFDMDGLIFDTEALYMEVILAVGGGRGHEMPASLPLATIGLPIEETRAKYLDHFGADFDFTTFWMVVKQRFADLARTQLRVKPGVVELLDALDAAGLPRAIATSSPHDDVRSHLTAHDLAHRFQTVIAKGDYLRGKPNPDPFLKAAARLETDPHDCLALEDSHNGVRSASSAGMMTIMVPDILPATDEMKKLCVLIARDLHEVKTLIG